MSVIKNEIELREKLLAPCSRPEWGDIRIPNLLMVLWACYGHEFQIQFPLENKKEVSRFLLWWISNFNQFNHFGKEECLKKILHFNHRIDERSPLAPSILMRMIWESRVDLQNAFPDVEGKDFWNWFFFDGFKEYNLPSAIPEGTVSLDHFSEVSKLIYQWFANVEARDQDAFRTFLRESHQKNADTHTAPTRLMKIIWANREDLQVAFPDIFEKDRTQFWNWFQTYGVSDYKIEFVESSSVTLENSGREQRISIAFEDRRYRVALIGHPTGLFGLGEDARLVREALEKEGFTVDSYIANVDVSGPRDGSALNSGLKLLSEYQDNYLCNIFCLPASDMLNIVLTNRLTVFSRTVNIGIWQWELPRFPQENSYAFELVHQVFSISNFSAQSIQSASTAVVGVVPLPVKDLTLPKPNREKFGLINERFYFLFSFDANSYVNRKNPLSCIEAFQRAFPKSQDVGLVMKVMNAETATSDLWRECCRRASVDNRITLITKSLPRLEYLELLSSIDALISLHRSEGFGRVIAEALLYQKPCVTSAWSGNVDFCNEETAYLVKGAEVTLYPTDYIFFKNNYWFEPDIDCAAGLMQSVKEHYAEACERAQKGRTLILSKYSLESTGRFMREIMQKWADIVLISESGFFDEGFYRKQIPENIENPIEHFLIFENSAKYSPSNKFDSKFYLENSPDVLAAQMNPLLHYLKHGQKEGRRTRAVEESKRIRSKNTGLQACSAVLLLNYADTEQQILCDRILSEKPDGGLFLLAYHCAQSALAASSSDMFLRMDGSLEGSVHFEEFLKEISTSGPKDLISFDTQIVNSKTLNMKAVFPVCIDMPPVHTEKPEKLENTILMKAGAKKLEILKKKPYSVIIPSYNYQRFLKERIESILEQTIPPDEILLLDDCSTDESVRLAQELLSASGVKHRIIVNETNNGVYKQWLKGISLAANNLVWISEADDLSDRKFAENLLMAFQNPNVKMSYSQSKLIDGEGAVTASNLLSHTVGIDAEKWESTYFETGRREVLDALIYRNTIPNASACIFDRSALDIETLGARLSKFRYCGDWMLYASLLEKGDVFFCSKVLNGFRRHSESCTVKNGASDAYLAELFEIKKYICEKFPVNAKKLNHSLKYINSDYKIAGCSKNTEHPIAKAMLSDCERQASVHRSVLFITTNDGSPVGGSEVLWVETAERLAKLSQYNVGVVIKKWEKEPTFIPHLRSLGVKILYKNSEVFDRIFEFQPDLVVFSLGDQDEGGMYFRYCQTSGFPYIIVNQLTKDSQFLRNDKNLIRSVYENYSRAKTAYFTCRKNVALFESRSEARLPNADVHFNPHHIRLDIGIEYPSVDQGLRLAVPARILNIHKGHDLIVEVLSQAKWQDRPLQVVFYGDGPDRPSIQEKIEKMNIRNISIKANAREMEDIWKECHGIFMASRMEGVPLVLVGAMLCGRMSVLTDVGGHRELVDDGIEGFIAPDVTVESIDEALERAWAKRSDWKSMGLMAREKIRRIIPEDPVADFIQKIEMNLNEA